MAILDVVPVAKKFQDRKPASQPISEYTSIDKGGRPITAAEQNIRDDRERFIDPVFDPIKGAASRAVRRIGDVFTPGGTPFMDQYRQQERQKAAQEISFEKKMQLRRENPKDVVRARATNMFDAAVRKYNDTGNPETLKMAEESIIKMIRLSGYAPQEFNLPGTIDISNVDPDPFKLDTTRPNPFPELEISAEVIMGTGASLYGATNTGARNFANAFKRGAKIGARAPVPGAWKFAASVLGGAFGVGSAYFGYEIGLDLYNQANKAKAIMQGRDPKTYAINRPGLGARLYRTTDLALTDGLLSAAILGTRPFYNSLRNITRTYVGGVGTEGAAKIKRGQELFDKFPTGGYGVEGKLPAELGSIPITPVPGGPRLQVGKTGLDDVAELRRGLFPFYWGNIERGAGEMPIQGTPYSISTLGNPMSGTVIQTGGRFPFLGSKIKQNLEEQGDILINLFHNMFAAYAPTVATRELMSHNILMAKRKTASRYLANLKRKLNRFRRHARETGYVIDGSPIRFTMEGVLDSVPKARFLDDTGAYRTDVKIGLGPEIRFPEGEKSFYNWVNNTLQGMLGPRSKFSVIELEKLFKDIETYARRYKDNPDVIDHLARIKKSTEASLGTIENSEARRLLDDFDNYATNGMLLFDSSAGRAFNAVDKFGFTLRLAEQGPRAADDLFATAFDAARPEAIRSFKHIVGPDVFNQTTRRFIQNAFEDSIEEGPKEGIKQIDFKKFRSILGLNDKAGNKYAALKEMLPGATPTSSVGREATATTPGGFSSKDFDATIKPGGLIPGAVMEGVESSTAKLPTVNDLEAWADMVEDVFKFGIPDVSTFIARRAQISGLRGAIRSFMPLSNVGSQHAIAAGGGAATGAFGTGIPIGIILGTLLTRHFTKIMTNPINLRVYKNAIDYKLPERARNAAIVRLFHLFRNEIEGIDKDLEQLEYQSTQPAKRSFIDRATENIGNVIQRFMPARSEPQAQVQPTIQTPLQQVTPTGGDVGGTQLASTAPVAGSSLAESDTLNPGAAQALYEGDTDAALAAQYAAEGGLMTLRK
jgi:hypothetical protein